MKFSSSSLIKGRRRHFASSNLTVICNFRSGSNYSSVNGFNGISFFIKYIFINKIAVIALKPFFLSNFDLNRFDLVNGGLNHKILVFFFEVIQGFIVAALNEFHQKFIIRFLFGKFTQLGIWVSLRRTKRMSGFCDKFDGYFELFEFLEFFSFHFWTIFRINPTIIQSSLNFFVKIDLI